MGKRKAWSEGEAGMRRVRQEGDEGGENDALSY